MSALYFTATLLCTFKWHQNAWFGIFLITHCPSVSLTDLPRKLWQRNTQKECVRSADLRPIHPDSSVVVVRTHHYEGRASGVSGGTVKLRHTLWRTLLITVDDSQWLWWLWMDFFFLLWKFPQLTMLFKCYCHCTTDYFILEYYQKLLIWIHSGQRSHARIVQEHDLWI